MVAENERISATVSALEPGDCSSSSPMRSATRALEAELNEASLQAHRLAQLCCLLLAAISLVLVALCGADGPRARSATDPGRESRRRRWSTAAPPSP